MKNKPLKQQLVSSPVKRMVEVRQILFNSEKKSVSSKFDAASNDSFNKSHWKIQGQFQSNDVQTGNYYSTIVGPALNPGEKVKYAMPASQRPSLIQSDNQRLQNKNKQQYIQMKNKETVPKTPMNQSNVAWGSINAEGQETKRLRSQADVNRRQINTNNQTQLKIHQQHTDMPGVASSTMKASRPDYGKSDMSIIYSNKDKREVFNIIQKRFNMSQFSKQTDATQAITQKRLDFSKFKLLNNTLNMSDLQSMNPDIQSTNLYGDRQTATTENKKNRFKRKLHPDYENYDRPQQSETTFKSKSLPKAVTKLRDAVKESNLFEDDQFFDNVVDQQRKNEKAGGNMIKPGDMSLLEKTSYPKTTEEILHQFRQTRQQKKKKHGQQSLMVGRTDYKLLDTKKLEVISNDRELVLEKQFAQGLSNNDTHQEGYIYMFQEEEDEKREKEKEVNPITQYIQNFQETEDMMQGQKDSRGKGMLGSIAKSLDQKIKKGIVMNSLANAMSSLAKLAQKARVPKHVEVVVDVLKGEEKKAESLMSVFNFVQSDEANAIRNIGNDLLKRMEYQQMFKQTEISDRKQFGFDLEYDRMSKSNTGNTDPKVQYFMQCKQQLEVALPILDKVYRKTLCLQDYQLSQGHCKGIAVACQYFDDKLVNRVLFQNNGMDGDQFAEILKGLSKLSDVKSIIYVQNGINSKALDALVPLLERKLPHHLQELRLIDIKSSASLMNDIITKISMGSQLSKLALVNCQQSDKIFEIIVNYVKESKFLKELDLSWCAVRQGTIYKLLQVIKQNKQLTHLNLSWNSLLEKQSLNLTPEDIAAGKTNPDLSPMNLEIMSCFKEFIKYNPNLIELNLSNTKLTNAAILYLCYCLQRATSLRTIHLCGNMSRPRFREQFSIEEDEEEFDPFFAIIRQVANRIKAKDGFKYMNIKTHDHHTEIEDSPDFKKIQNMKKCQSISPAKKEASTAPNVNALERHKQLLTMLSKGLNNQLEDKATNEVDSLAWRHLRAGLRVRNIMQATRMHDIKLSATNVEQKKLLITRQLGFSKLCQGSAQWEILTKANQECWVCGQWNFTLFIWTTRFGQIASTKDLQKVKHYTESIRKNEDDELMPRIFEIPHIGAAFNDWRWQKMINMVDYCMENDQNAPDFLKIMIDKKEVRAACGEPHYDTLNEHEISRIGKFRREYYQENWPKMILEHIPLKKPNIANVQSLTSVSEEFDVTEEVFFHCAFVKPGRHDYVVRFTHMEFNRDAEVDEKGITMNTIQGKLNLQLSGKLARQIDRKKSLRNREIYIHEFIASFRQEELPQYHKERKMEQKIIQKFEAKDVFRDFKEDTYETVAACIAADTKNIRYNEICNFDERDMKMTDDKVKTNFKLIKQVYQFLQAKSKRFPLVDHKTLFEHFIKPAEVTQHSALVIQDIEIIYLESKFDPRDESHSSQNGMARWQFCEFLCRLAKYLFLGNKKDLEEQTFRRNHSKLYEGKEYDKSNITDIRVHNAVHMMCTTVISRWADNVTAPTHENFRKYDLWVHAVELLFTMNEAALKQVYNFLCQNKQGEDDKPMNMDVLALSDCRWFFIHELKLKLKKAEIQLCFAESKMTIINEQEKDSTNKYKKLVYVEFLEFIARIALKLFQDSELEDQPLNQKIETVLDYMFDYLHLEKEKQQIHIEEFSASDNDY